MHWTKKLLIKMIKTIRFIKNLEIRIMLKVILSKQSNNYLMMA